VRAAGVPAAANKLLVVWIQDLGMRATFPSGDGEAAMLSPQWDFVPPDLLLPRRSVSGFARESGGRRTGDGSPALVVPVMAAAAFGRCSLPVQGSWSEVADPVFLLRFHRTEQPELEPTSTGMNPGRRATGAMALPFAAGFLFDSESLFLGDGAPSACGIVVSCAFLRRRLGVRGGRPWAMVFLCAGTPRGFFVFFLSLGSFVHMYWDTCSLPYLPVVSACVMCACTSVG
jgi:hypothetical protein